ncbi:MAG: hypothetical protein AAF708_07635 [Deinococcota bacterium]
MDTHVDATLDAHNTTSTSAEPLPTGATPTGATESGVQALIDKLRYEGVSAGKREAAEIVETAKAEAEAILATAKAESSRLLTHARRHLESEQHAANEALQLAARDTALNLKAQLLAQFRSQLQQLVRSQLADADLLKQLILELAGEARTTLDAQANGQAKNILVSLAEETSDTQDTQTALDDLVGSLTSELLQDGVQLAANPQPNTQQGHTGLRVQLVGDNLELDFSDEAVTNLLAQHLLPRFRKLLEAS